MSGGLCSGCRKSRARRSMYTPERIPNWVVIDGDVEYRGFLRSKGVELPPMVDDRDSMDDDSDDSSKGDEDIAEGTVTAQPSTMAANKFEPQTPKDTHGNPQTPIHSHPRNPPMEATDKKPWTATEAMDNEPRAATETKPRTPMEVKVREVPKKDPAELDIAYKLKPMPVTVRKYHTKRGMGRSAELEEKMNVAEARMSHVG